MASDSSVDFVIERVKQKQRGRDLKKILEQKAGQLKIPKMNLKPGVIRSLNEVNSSNNSRKLKKIKQLDCKKALLCYRKTKSVYKDTKMNRKKNRVGQHIYKYVLTKADPNTQIIRDINKV